MPDASPALTETLAAVDVAAMSPAGGEKAAKPAKGDKGKAAKGKKEPRKGKKEPVQTGDGPTVAAHPRAARSIARAKGWGGLLAFSWPATCRCRRAPWRRPGCVL